MKESTTNLRLLILNKRSSQSYSS